MRVLFVNTKQRPPLGADTWVHLEIMRELDRSRVEVHAACATGPTDNPTPTYQRLREIPEVEIVGVNLGREIAGTSMASKALRDSRAWCPRRGACCGSRGTSASTRSS